MVFSLRCGLFKALWVFGTWLFCVPLVHADMWTYVDARGVKHFASSQLDTRYKLMFRGMAASDAAGQSDSGTPTTVAHYAPISGAGRSVSRLELSPGFMAVKSLVRMAADANQLDIALLQAVIATESGFDSSAVSPKGAVGLMQVMPATAQRYGVAGDRGGSVSTKLADPRTNINTGARYLRDLINLFPGQLELAVAAYNAGEGAVQKAGNRIPAYKETQNYVRSVMSLYKRLNPQFQSTVASVPAPTELSN
jgi:soluble lytic murein transglycosylase-like protein